MTNNQQNTTYNKKTYMKNKKKKFYIPIIGELKPIEITKIK